MSNFKATELFLHQSLCRVPVQGYVRVKICKYKYFFVNFLPDGQLCRIFSTPNDFKFSRSQIKPLKFYMKTVHNFEGHPFWLCMVGFGKIQESKN